MSLTIQNQTISAVHQLANWLASKESDPSISSKIEYHLVGRAALAGESVLFLIETIGRVALGCIAFLGYLIALGYWQPPKNFGIEQMQSASYAWSDSFNCLCSILSPKELINRSLTPETRDWRVRQGATQIAAKLDRQFERAQDQAKQEPNKPFQYLPAPKNFEGEAHTESVANYEVGVCHFIGRRPTMEDEHLTTSFDLQIMGVTYPVQVFGIFDGHGGHDASLYLKKNLERELHETLNEFCSKELTDEAIWNALKITFVKLDKKFNELQSGSTATVALILDGKLWTANVGDSRTILDNGIQLSEDAKPTDPYYAKGIANRGGRVIGARINGVLAVGRAIGDHDVGAINPRPKITVYPVANIPKGSHLILTCDGIYDVSSTRQIAAAIQENKKQLAETLAKNIVYSAYQAGSGDNLSALVVKF